MNLLVPRLGIYSVPPRGTGVNPAESACRPAATYPSAVMGEQICAALAADYRVLGQRHPSLALDTDTQELRRELGGPATPVVQWAKGQTWEAAAAAMNA